MAKVRVDTKRVTEKIKSAFKDLMTKDDMYADIANFAVERIKQKARLSKRMVTDGSDSESLPKLSVGYVAMRKKLSRGQGTDPNFFLPNVVVSQLTFTGQLLNSLKGKIVKKGIDVGKIELEFSGGRDDGQTNKSVYNELLERNKSYEVLALSKKAIALIRNKVLTRLRQELIKKKLK